MTCRLITLIYCLLTITCVYSEEEEPKEELFLSTPDQVVTLMSEPSYLVGGLVSPLSGQTVLRNTDLIAKGAQNIILSRAYVPLQIPCSFPKHKHNQEEYNKKHLYEHLQKNYKGWQFYPHCMLQLDLFLMEVRLSEPNGITFDFRLSGPNYSVTVLASPSYGFNNVAEDVPSGKYDPRNTRILYEENGSKITVHSTDGTIRFYYKKERRTRSSFLYLLEKEILPNGKVLKYHYNERKQLDYIESRDPKEQYVYASIRIAGAPSDGNCHFIASSGMTADYSYQSRIIHAEIKEKFKTGGFEGVYNFVYPPLLTSVRSPFYRHESLDYCGRFLLSSYSGKDDIFTTLHTGFGDDVQYYRVHKILLPVGENDVFVPVYELSYQPAVAGIKEGTTTVKNSDGTSIIYHFSKNLLTTLIQFFGQDGKLKKEKILSWDERNWLKSIEMRDGQKKLFYRKSYEYDRFGNPVIEIFTGDLIGEGGQENYTTRRTFSEDGRNLLLREETEDGKVLCFSYLPNTNLVTSKLTKNSDKIILREFFEYDDCHNLVKKIIDDGSSEDKNNLSAVSQRTITEYHLRQQSPFLHMPEWIEEKYLDNGEEKSIKKMHLNYDTNGNVAQEDIYDEAGEFVYSIYKKYNERGDIISETNPIGQIARYEYDDRGNCILSSDFSQKLEREMHYDARKRLRRRNEIGANEEKHTYLYEYDINDNLVQKVDFFDQATQYEYDPLTNKPIKTLYPAIASLEEEIPVITSSIYDALGRELSKTDANNNTTQFFYSSYGSLTESLHPDGSRELWRYYKNGKLKSYEDKERLKTLYHYDILGRLVSKTFLSLENKIIAEETYSYNAFHLVQETDKEGHVLTYAYNKAGRKIQENHEGRITEFVYDSLGRVYKIIMHNPDNLLAKTFKYDLLDRILEETETDAKGKPLTKVTYGYDEAGNRSSIIYYVHDQPAEETFTYDAFDRVIVYQDALGNITTTTYYENHPNLIDQKVLQVISCDPTNIKTVKTHDAFGRLIRKERYDRNGQTIFSQIYIFDPCGNLILIREQIYEGTKYLKTGWIKQDFNNVNRLESITRAYGTPDERKTRFTYTPSSRLQSKTLPDNNILIYQYDLLGHLTELTSSNHDLHQIFRHNRLGQLLECSDLIQNTHIKRELDAFGNITKESFGPRLDVTKAYDAFDRPLSIRLPDQSEIHFKYDPKFLKEVMRVSSDKVLYSHGYESYDLAGNLLSEKLLNNLGPVTHTYDPMGRTTHLASPYLNQGCRYDTLGNLIQTQINEYSYEYGYDSLSQLISESSVADRISYRFDSHYNCTQTNTEKAVFNHLDELVGQDLTTCTYDLNGNQSFKKTQNEQCRFVYDPLNRLIEAMKDTTKITFTYDALNRRLSKTVTSSSYFGWQNISSEYYVYDNQNELGAFTQDGKPKQIRIPGLLHHSNLTQPVALELDGHLLVPLLDAQRNIRSLITPSGKVLSHYRYSAFGKHVQVKESHFNPWRYASKRFDPELNLIYFGKRYYDPEFGRWLTTDPADFRDSTNLYQYLFNNPFRYVDPDGKYVMLIIPLLELSWPTIIQAVAYTAMAAGLTWSAVEMSKAMNSPTYYDTADAYNRSAEYEDNDSKKKKPPYDGKELGEDPAKCPGEGFEWRGKGSPGSGAGSWVKGEGTTKEILYPDLDHSEPIGPHWDYTGPGSPKGARLYPDGTWEPKP